MFNIKTNELILMYLQGYDKSEEVSYYITKNGIIDGLNIDGLNTQENEIDTCLNNLSDKGLIEEDIMTVSGHSNKKNVYFLTKKGISKEKNIWNRIKDQEVLLKTKESNFKIKLNKLDKYIGGRNPIIEGIKRLEDGGKIDMTNISKPIDFFVGRKKELNYLKKQLKKVKDDGVEFILIEGEAGIGKTSLVSKLKPFAEELGFEFLSGICQSEISDPYLPFKEAFDKYIENEKHSDNVSNMAFIGIGEKKKTEDKSIFDANKKQTFYDTTRFIKNLSKENPLLIFLDDLQWVDRATLDILVYMLSKLEDFPILFIGTYRPEDVSSKHHLRDMKHRLTRENRIKNIDLNPLDLQNTKDTVKSLLNEDKIPDQFIELVHEKTEGNPLFIKESIKQMVDDGIIDTDKNKYPKKEENIVTSELVHNVIERRLKRFDDETKKIMEIGSIIGGSIPYDLLLETSKMDEIELLDHVDLLIEEQFWEEDPEDELFYFSHNLIEKTVYKQIRDMKKKLIHKKIADNIKNIYSHEIEKWYPNLARHYEGGKDYSNALDYYLKAGEKAEEVYANEDAIEMYEKALDLSKKTKGKEIDRINILENLSRAYSLLGKYKKSREYLNDVMDIDHIDKDKKAKLYSKIGNIFTKEGEYDKGLQKVEKGLELIDNDTKSKADLLSMKGWISIRHSEYEQAKDIFKEEMHIAEEIDDREAISQAYHNLGTAYNFLKEFENSEKHLKKAKELRNSENEIEDKAKTLNNLGVLYENINIDKTLEYYQKSLEKAEKIGNIHLSIGLLSNIGRVYYHKAEFDKAIENLNESLEIRKRIGDKYGISLSYVNLGLVYTDKGKFDKAEEYHERSLAIVDEMGESYCKAINLRSLGKIYELKGDQEKSYDYYQKSLQCSKDGGNKAQTSLNYSYISEYYLKSGNIQKSKEMAEKSLTLSNEIKTIRENAIAYGMLGRIYNRKGNVEKAIDYLEKAKKKLMKSGFDLDLAKINLYLGKIYDIKEKEISNKYFNEAKSTFEKSEMKPWLKMINKSNN